MSTLLVINPNTTVAVTEALVRHVQAELGGDVAVHGVTAAFGASYIATEVGYAVAAHATLDAYARFVAANGMPDAVLIGCFGDPGLFALRTACPVPVSGLAQAAFHEARRQGQFAIVTGGDAWGPMLRRHAQALGCDDELAGIVTVAPSGAALAADPARARALLAAACHDAAARSGARSVILGGAGLAGIAAEIADRIDVPVIDSVRAGARQALRGQAPPVPQPETAAFSALSPALQALLAER